MVTSLAPAGVTRRAVEALSERFVEPAWMRMFRLEAFDAYERLPIPTTADEEWRRTDLSGFHWEDFRVDSEPVAGPTERSELPAGVIFTTLLAAVVEHSDLVRELSLS